MVLFPKVKFRYKPPVDQTSKSFDEVKGFTHQYLSGGKKYISFIVDTNAFVFSSIVF